MGDYVPALDDFGAAFKPWKTVVLPLFHDNLTVQSKQLVHASAAVDFRQLKKFTQRVIAILPEHRLRVGELGYPVGDVFNLPSKFVVFELIGGEEEHQGDRERYGYGDADRHPNQ